jgi:hypothetical protein
MLADGFVCRDVKSRHQLFAPARPILVRWGRSQDAKTGPFSRQVGGSKERWFLRLVDWLELRSWHSQSPTTQRFLGVIGSTPA